MVKQTTDYSLFFRFPRMQLWSFVKGCFLVVVAKEHDDSEERETSPTSHSNSEKCQLRLSSSLFFAPSMICGRKRKWMKKAILEQILDIPCRSILIRSSKMFRCGLSICSCSVVYIAMHLFTHGDYSSLDEGTNAKLSCCWFWLIINFILVSSTPTWAIFISAQTQQILWKSLNVSAENFGRRR